MNEPQSPNNGLWYCDVCEKEMKFRSILRHIISNRHIHKEKFGLLVKEYEIFKLEIDEIDYILDKAIKDCRDNFFHSF